MLVIVEQAEPPVEPVVATTNRHVIRAYKERVKKPDDQCAPITLCTRKYAYLRRRRYENRCEELKEKARSKYHTDPEYRSRKLAQMKAKRDAARKQSKPLEA